jgi:neutral ceramidase
MQRAEVQAITLNEYALVGIPAELFVELGLQIKERAYPMRASVVGLANGMVGYVPPETAFERGGYETTLSDASKLSPAAGRPWPLEWWELSDPL